MHVHQVRLGDLDARIVSATPPHDPGPVVVLMHGFGAPGTDLVSLAQVLEAPPGTRFVFPQGPLELGAGFGGRAWWMIDIIALETAMASGTFRDLSRQVPDGLTEAREKVESCLAAIELELTPTRLALGGFSQGAMLATDVALHSERDIALLVLFSGTVIAEPIWASVVARRQGLQVVQSHGLSDPILPYQGAERLRALLEEGGLRVRFVPFQGGHEIPASAVQASSELFMRALAASDG